MRTLASILRRPAVVALLVLVVAAAGCVTSFEGSVQPVLTADTDGDGIPDVRDDDDDGDGIPDLEDSAPLTPAPRNDTSERVGPRFLRGPTLEVPRLLA